MKQVVVCCKQLIVIFVNEKKKLPFNKKPFLGLCIIIANARDEGSSCMQRQATIGSHVLGLPINSVKFVNNEKATREKKL